MNSYLEVTWLLMLAVSMASASLAFSLVSLTVHRKKIVLILALISFLETVGYAHWYWIVLAEAITALLLFRRMLKAFLQMELTRLFFLTLGKVWCHGVLVNGVLFVESGTSRWIGYLLFLGSMNLLFWKLVAPRIFRERFEMKVVLKNLNGTLRCQGYLDSGNSLCCKGRPVVFLAVRYSEFIKGIQSKTISYQTIGVSNQCQIYPCEIYLLHDWKNAYVAFSSQLPPGIDCLLNSQLFV